MQGIRSFIGSFFSSPNSSESQGGNLQQQYNSTSMSASDFSHYPTDSTQRSKHHFTGSKRNRSNRSKTPVAIWPDVPEGPTLKRHRSAHVEAIPKDQHFPYVPEGPNLKRPRSAHVEAIPKDQHFPSSHFYQNQNKQTQQQQTPIFSSYRYVPPINVSNFHSTNFFKKRRRSSGRFDHASSFKIHATGQPVIRRNQFSSIHSPPEYAPPNKRMKSDVEATFAHPSSSRSKSNPSPPPFDTPKARQSRQHNTNVSQSPQPPQWPCFSPAFAPLQSSSRLGASRRRPSLSSNHLRKFAQRRRKQRQQEHEEKLYANPNANQWTPTKKTHSNRETTTVNNDSKKSQKQSVSVRSTQGVKIEDKEEQNNKNLHSTPRRKKEKTQTPRSSRRRETPRQQSIQRKKQISQSQIQKKARVEAQQKREQTINDRIDKRRASLAQNELQKAEYQQRKEKLRKIIAPHIQLQVRDITPYQMIMIFYPSIRLSKKPSLTQLQNAFKRTLARYHPDKMASKGEEDLDEIVRGEEIYKVIGQTYEELRKQH